MASWKLTLMEYHSHGDGLQLFPDGGREPNTEDAPTDGSNAATYGVAAFIGLAFLVGTAVVVRYLRQREQEVGGEQISITEYEE